MKLRADEDWDELDDAARARKPGYDAEVKEREARRKAAGIPDPSQFKSITVDATDEEPPLGKEHRSPRDAAATQRERQPGPGFARVPYTIVDHLGPVMPPYVFMAYVVCIRLNDFQTGEFRISHKTLGRRIGGRSAQTGKRALRLLRECGLVETVKRGGPGLPSTLRVVKEIDVARVKAVFHRAHEREDRSDG